MADMCSFMTVTSPSYPEVELTEVAIYRHLTSEPITTASVGDMVDFACKITNVGTANTGTVTVGVYINGNLWFTLDFSDIPPLNNRRTVRYLTIVGPGNLTICAATI